MFKKFLSLFAVGALALAVFTGGGGVVTAERAEAYATTQCFYKTVEERSIITWRYVKTTKWLFCKRDYSWWESNVLRTGWDGWHFYEPYDKRWYRYGTYAPPLGTLVMYV